MRSIFFIFSVLYIIAAIVNHVDDTDETFGYWEPLHYLLYGHGMQTWEYSPKYAIRTYSFIIPFLLVGKILRIILSMFNINELLEKQICYYGIKIILGLFSAYSQSSLITIVKNEFGNFDAYILGIFLLSSAGIFYASTSLLPSALCLNFVTLSICSLLQSESEGDIRSNRKKQLKQQEKQHLKVILIGSVAVLWTGWPFIGLLFLPMGLFVLYDKFTGSSSSSNSNGSSSNSGIRNILIFGIQSMILVIVTLLPTILVDYYYYGKWTWPSLNIFVYNTGTSLFSIFGLHPPSASGDLLYGVEPISYYVKNMLLMLGICAPLGVLSVFLLPFASLFEGKRVVVVASSACVWLAVMFSRPHKEERFLYPIYTSFCFMAMLAVRVVTQILNNIWNNITTSSSSRNSSKIRSNKSVINNKYSAFSIIKLCVFVMVTAMASLIGVARVRSSLSNYKGIMQVWRRLGIYLYQDFTSGSGGRISSDDLGGSQICTHMNSEGYNSCNLNRDNYLWVCSGNDWYTFPSHFFLPNHVRYGFYRQEFGGQLPQYYTTPIEMGKNQGRRRILGTRMGIDNFNSLNQEEMSRYRNPKDCQWTVETSSEAGTTVDDVLGATSFLSSFVPLFELHNKASEEVKYVKKIKEIKEPILHPELSPGIGRALCLHPPQVRNSTSPTHTNDNGSGSGVAEKQPFTSLSRLTSMFAYMFDCTKGNRYRWYKAFEV